MPATLQPVIVTPSLPLLLAFYKALLGAVEISRMPEDGPAFYVGLQIGNAELGMVADGDADVAAPQRILLNVNVADLGVGDVESLLEHVDVLGGRVLGPPNDMPWGQRVAHILDPDGNTVNLTEPLPSPGQPTAAHTASRPFIPNQMGENPRRLSPSLPVTSVMPMSGSVALGRARVSS
jgi:predicted enzyme related to lactoylglutathione lyase